MPETDNIFQISNRLGLHARAAASFVKVAGAHKCDVKVSKDDVSADGKSIMGIMMLAAPQGSDIHVACSGVDANECLTALGELINNRFGEEQ